MKSYTDIEQSKKLAEFLPIESADMFWADGERPAVWVNKDVELDYIGLQTNTVAPMRAKKTVVVYGELQTTPLMLAWK